MSQSCGKRISLEVQAGSQKGKRHNQQDQIGWSSPEQAGEQGALFILSDGMGGMKNGEQYSNIAVQQMGKSFLDLKNNESSMKKLLLACYRKARQEAQAICKDPDSPEGGATVVAVLIKGNRCMFLSVGDSKLYLWRNNGLVQLNREQTTGVLLDINVAFGYIPKEYARSSMRDTLDNNLCEPEEKLPDMPSEPFELVDGDILLLMSDGITHTLTDMELTALLKNAKSYDKAKLIEHAVERKNDPDQDNYSIVAVHVHIK